MLHLLETTMLLHNWSHSNMWLGLALNLPCMNDKGNSCSYSCLIEWVNRSMVKTTGIPVIFITILLYIEQLHCQKSIHLPETDGWVGKNNDWHFYTLLKSMLGYHVIVEFVIQVEKCFIKFWQIVFSYSFWLPTPNSWNISGKCWIFKFLLKSQNLCLKIPTTLINRYIHQFDRDFTG